ncbi:MAG: signal peptide peptidase SppA [Candidatus Cloacimonetes bacterium]|nr:signal peptide peptidase SppA [Candidatus Cloacimonadota bacterium]
MKAYKPFIWLILFGVFACTLAAQSAPFNPELLQYPLASVDDQFIPYVNPALLGAQHNSDLGFAQIMDKDGWIKQHILFVNAGGSSYVYENCNNTSFHNLSGGFALGNNGILRNIYLGSRYSWQNSSFGKGWWRSGATVRPHNSASMAFVWDNPQSGPPAYRAGISLRPLQWFLPQHGYRLELSGDMGYRKEIDANDPTLLEYKFGDAVVGVKTQVLDGLMVGATYNLDSENLMLNFGLRFGKTNLSNIITKTKDGDPIFIPHIGLGDYNYKSFLGLNGRKWYEMKLDKSIVSYKAPSYELGPVKIFDGKTRSIEDLVRELERVAEEPGIEGIVLVNPSFGTSFALMEELVRAFDAFKATGKKVECYYDNISNGGYIFASAIADNIMLNPTGILDLRGFSVTSPYLGEMLDSLGVEVINFRSHKYKSAGNMFSESSMTESERETYEALLDTFYDTALAQIAKGRGDRLQDTPETLVENGPYLMAQEAVDAGLVDKLIYQDQLDEHLKENYGFKGRRKDLHNYLSYNWHIPSESKIAVIYASGNIVMGKGTPGKMIAEESTVNLIRKARKDPSYKGIILRVDSGGGSAQASDIILRELELAQIENNKPVVVSMAGAAASGGYYIACKADKIIAEATTITGSIGVIGIMFNAERMFNKIRVNWSTVKKGRNSDFPSIYRGWSEEEKQRMTDFIEVTYEDFVNKVAAGRQHLSLDEVNEYAQGRVWSGKDALERGLIDELGGMDTAIESMRELAGIKGKIRLVDATTSTKGIRVNMSKGIGLSALDHPLFTALDESYIRLYELWRDYEGQNPLMLSPIQSQDIEF